MKKKMASKLTENNKSAQNVGASISARGTAIEFLMYWR